MTIEYGKLCTGVRPANTSEVQFYSVPASTEINAVLRICNQDVQANTFRLAQCDAAHGDVAANVVDWIFYDEFIPPGKTKEVSIAGKATETLRIAAGKADVMVFNLSGQKVT